MEPGNQDVRAMDLFQFSLSFFKGSGNKILIKDAAASVLYVRSV